jgi:hypothetical protein
MFGTIASSVNEMARAALRGCHFGGDVTTIGVRSRYQLRA